MTDVMTPWYNLQILVAGQLWSVFGERPSLQDAMREWREWTEDPAADDDDVLVLTGVSNTVDRADKKIVVKMRDISAMDLTYYSG